MGCWDWVELVGFFNQDSLNEKPSHPCVCFVMEFLSSMTEGVGLDLADYLQFAKDEVLVGKGHRWPIVRLISWFSFGRWVIGRESPLRCITANSMAYRAFGSLFLVPHIDFDLGADFVLGLVSVHSECFTVFDSFSAVCAGFHSFVCLNFHRMVQAWSRMA